jgi:predicted regulator of Ras-like GTPase activity (Roadblock/LC7/MglB family)
LCPCLRNFWEENNILCLDEAAVENLNATKRGKWKEGLITTDAHHIILQKLSDNVFFALTLTKDQGNLGRGRLQMEQLSRRVIKELT